MMKLEYRYYAVNSDGKIVCGFQDERSATEYAVKWRYKVFSFKSLQKKGIDPVSVEDWAVALFDATSSK